MEGGGRGGVADEELWGGECGEGVEGETLFEEEANGEGADAGVGEGDGEGIESGGGKDEGGDRGIADGQGGGKAGACAGAEEEDVVFGDGAGFAEVAEGGGCIVRHALLGGVDGGALAVASVVEGEEVEAEGVEDGQISGVVGALSEGCISSAKVEDGVGGVAAGGCGGEEDSGELGQAGFGGVEVDLFGGETGQGVEGLGGALRVQDELPLALVEEEAQGDVAADEGSEDGEANGFEEPERADDLGEIFCGCLLGWRAFGLGLGGWGGLGARHGSLRRLAPTGGRSR